MDQAKSVAQGFIASASAIWLVTFVMVSIGMNLWLGLGLFLFLAVPFSIHAVQYLKSLKGKKPAQTRVKQAKNILMSMQGVGFACWFFDVLSTIFVVNIKQSDSELNPLGWPFGAVGALAYYIPITFVAYCLLFKVKSKESFYGAVGITAVSLFMGARNLNAGLLSNFPRIGLFTFSNAADLEILFIWLAILVTLRILNIMAIIKNKVKVSSIDRALI